tara:strand:+ start:394 stop:762 length:369 start_codon:yes stop_codon:yes gene_type:complete
MDFWYGLGINNLEERVKAYILENLCERSETKLKKYKFEANPTIIKKHSKILTNINKDGHIFTVQTSDKNIKKIIEAFEDCYTGSFVEKFDSGLHETGPRDMGPDEYIKKNKIKFISFCETNL